MFKPNPQLYGECAQHLNGLKGTFRRRTFQIALSDVEGDVDPATEMLKEAYSSAGSIINAHQHKDYDQVESVTVPMQKGDQIIEEYPELDPTVFKIDVEETEYGVLKGLEGDLSMGKYSRILYRDSSPELGFESFSRRLWGQSRRHVFKTG